MVDSPVGNVGSGRGAVLASRQVRFPSPTRDVRLPPLPGSPRIHAFGQDCVSFATPTHFGDLRTAVAVAGDLRGSTLEPPPSFSGPQALSTIIGS